MAGLVGALGGAALGAAGAWGAALIAFRAAKYQADRQSDAQHQQWLRQIRRETYANFLAAADAARLQLFTASMARRLSRDEEGEAEHARLRGAAVVDQQKFEEARAALNLEAPEEIREKAAELAKIFTGLFKASLWLRARDRSALLGYMKMDQKRIDRTSELIKDIHELCRDSLTRPQ